MSRKHMSVFEVYNRNGEDITVTEDYAITDSGELLKKNEKGLWLPVPEKGELLLRYNGRLWRW